MRVNEPAQIVPLTKTPTQPPDVQDPSLARLLFCEVLLEEYDGLDQPPLDPEGLAKIKDSLQEYREMYRVMDDSHREHAEPAFAGEMMGRIYALFNKAQATHAENVRARFRQMYSDVSDDTEREKVVDCAVVAKVLGDFDRLRDSFVKQSEEIEDATTRDAFVETKIRETIRNR